MARLLTAGWETGSLSELNGARNGITSASTAQKRTGTYSLYVQAGSYQAHVLDANEPEVFFRFALRIGTNPLSSPDILKLYDDGYNLHVQLTFDYATQTLNWRDAGGAVLGYGHVPLALGVWYIIELRVLISNTAGVLVCKVNAVTDAVYNGDTCATDGEHVRQLRFQAPGGGSAAAFWIDDLAVNNTAGAAENSYPGLGGVFFLVANGDGATTDFAPSTGTDHYACVDDIPANSTDYVEGADPGDIELFNVQDTPEYVTVINLVQPIFQAAIAASGANELRDVVRADGVNYAGDTIYTVVSITPDYVLYRGKVYYEHPDGVTGALTTAHLDALQMGVEIPT